MKILDEHSVSAIKKAIEAYESLSPDLRIYIFPLFDSDAANILIIIWYIGDRESTTLSDVAEHIGYSIEQTKDFIDESTDILDDYVEFHPGDIFKKKDA